jgi:membrane-bound serine protease (ClpP class)
MSVSLNKLFVVFCNFFLILFYRGEATENQPVRLILEGHLSKEILNNHKNNVEKIEFSTPQILVIEINSTSGDLEDTFALAKAIYELKITKHLHVIVYLNDSVIGPAALVPFLADELNCSLVVSWGDIPLGSENTLSSNLLRNRVRSLINAQNPHAPLLFILADAMTDSSFQVIDDQGWKLVKNGKEMNEKAISAPGQTLVINQNQLKELGLVRLIASQSEFEASYHFKQIEKNEMRDNPLQLSTQSVETELQKSIYFQMDGPNTIGYLYIGDHESSINQSTWLYVKQGLDYYKKSKPAFIILELNTPGGEVFAAQKISDALKEMDTQYNIPIVAFIDNWAISAGAMLAYSCRFIASVKDGSMGAAEPVYAGEGGKMEAASEKVNSALRADFANRARFFDRNPLIAEAMVDKDLILVIRHGKVLKLDNENQIKLTGSNPDKILSPKGKLLTLDAESMLAYGVADLLLAPQKLNSITDEEKSIGQWPANKMLLFQTPFFSKIPQATIQAYQMDWKTHFFVLLATPLVSSLLFMGLMIGGYLEFNNPGLSLPGSVAAICLFLIILSSFSLEIANWLELILLLTGIILLLVEFFVLPTFGLLGVVGFILLIVGLFGMLLPGIDTVSFEYDTKVLNAAGQYVIERLAWLCGAFILSSFIIAYLARYVLPAFSGFNRFVLAGHEQDASKGFVAGDNPLFLPQPGAQGVVWATLRPTGKIMVQDKIYDAISEEGFIEEKEPILIIRLEGSSIFVNRLKENKIL